MAPAAIVKIELASLKSLYKYVRMSISYQNYVYFCMFRYPRRIKGYKPSTRSYINTVVLSEGLSYC